MSNKHNLLLKGMALACAVLSACADDKYDLSDLDTTVRIDVDHLVVPVKLDDIRLESIIPDDKRVKVIDGNYMFVETGRYWSNQVYIEPIWFISQLAEATSTTIPYVEGQYEYDFSISDSEFEIYTNKLPADITYIDRVSGDIVIKIMFALERVRYFARSVKLTDMVIGLPAGMTVVDADGGVYDPESGELSVAEIDAVDDYPVLTVKISRADLTCMNSVIEEDPRKLRAKGVFGIKSGKIKLIDPIEDPKTSQFTIFAACNVSDFKLQSYSGGFDYSYKGLTFDLIRMDGLPDFLGQTGTDIKLANPCLFLKSQNPMQSYGLYSLTGLYINAYHDRSLVRYGINQPDFRIGNENPDGIYNFCLSPEMPEILPEGFEGAEHVRYDSLSNVLSSSGNPDYGIPVSLEVKMARPRIPEQYIEDMPVGVYLDDARGTYEFRAPLALKEGSVIKYHHTATGWGSEEFEDITVTQLDIDAELTCDIPLELDLRAYPVNKHGEVINNVEIKGLRINAGTQPQPVHISITGDVTGFDGVRYEAVATSSRDEALRTDMNIRIYNLRPTISGYYLKDI